MRHHARGGAGLDRISLRTFSKAYGLAGARVGYGLCASPALTRALHKTRNPRAVNAFAGAAALAAAGHEVVPSQANFLFFRTPGPAADFAETLRRRGVLVKGWQEPPFLDWARVTIATPAENDAFLDALP